MTINDLRVGQQFTFPSLPRSVYVSRGNGWYDGGRGYEGGAWHVDRTTVVLAVDTVSDEWEEHLAHRAQS